MHVYYTKDIMSVHVVRIEGKCEVTTKEDLPNSNLPVVVEHAFYCEHYLNLILELSSRSNIA
jgi:DNA (cytosine-5)-methyltransferase 1